LRHFRLSNKEISHANGSSPSNTAEGKELLGSPGRRLTGSHGALRRVGRLSLADFNHLVSSRKAGFDGRPERSNAASNAVFQEKAELKIVPLLPCRYPYTFEPFIISFKNFLRFDLTREALEA